MSYSSPAQSQQTESHIELNHSVRSLAVLYLQALMTSGKVNLDIFWLRDESLEDSANLPNPDVLALEIVEDLKAALSQFESIEEDLSGEE